MYDRHVSDVSNLETVEGEREMTDGKVLWLCKKCNHEFYPESDNIKCPNCNANSTVPLREIWVCNSCFEEFYKSPRRTDCPNCHSRNMTLKEQKKPEMRAQVNETASWKSEHQTQLPNPDEPLICAFQRRFSTPYRIQCAVTAIGGGGIISRAFANYEKCLIDICPMYQNWKKEK
jgi:Zn finger protein HypA/HybF involved in hydrogenase expression